MIPSFERYIPRIDSARTIRVEGQVTKVVGTIIEGKGPAIPVGGVCQILPPNLQGQDLYPVSRN